MSITFETGDLLTTKVDAIAHGCNLDGVMGAGVAKAVHVAYGANMHYRYRRWCEGGAVLGEFNSFRTTLHGLPVLYNLATQLHPGAWADLAAIAVSLDRALFDCGKQGCYSLAIPRIGAGIGGLDWHSQVLPMLDWVATANRAVRLIVVSLEGQA